MIMVSSVASNCRPVRVPLSKAVWIGKTPTRQSLKEHLESTCHKEALRMESSRVLAQRQGGIAACFDTVVSILHWTIEMHALSR